MIQLIPTREKKHTNEVREAAEVRQRVTPPKNRFSPIATITQPIFKATKERGEDRSATSSDIQPPKTEPIRRPSTQQKIRRVRYDITKRSGDQRFQHELKEMKETEDLERVDDDVEELATLFEWRALEHSHRPKSARWYAVYAAAITAISVGFLFYSNIIGAITIGFIGALVYYVVQQEPRIVRYRIMADGIAFDNLLYHYRDLESFNIVYEPGETKTVFLKSKKLFSPLLHMEIGDADPVAIRDMLLEFVREDQEMDEPVLDILARRLGF